MQVSVSPESVTKFLEENPRHYMKLDLTFPYQETLALLQELPESSWRPHRESEGHRGWSGISLRGMRGQELDAPENFGFTNQTAPYYWTQYSRDFKALTNFLLKDFPFSIFHRIRIMRLAPGGIILAHKDYEKRRLWGINFCLNWPKECTFQLSQGGQIPLEAGDCFLTDLSQEHTVTNESKEHRYMMIVHGRPGERLEEFVALLNRSQQRAENE